MVDTTDTVTPESPPPPAPAPRRTWGDWVRFALRGIGQLLITAGVVVLLFVVYEVYVTNYFAHEAQAKVRNEYQTEIIHDHDPLAHRLKLPDGTLVPLPNGKGIANLYIPRLGSDYKFTIVEGTTDADLGKGPGHYAGTALPGQVGNFAVAGHRVGKGEPFLNLDHLRAGDAVIVETGRRWYVYRVKGTDHDNIDSNDADGIPGREVVSPGDGDVLDNVPNHPGNDPTERLMTMTTCHPKFTAANRMIIFSKLAQSYPADGLTMPDQVKALYTEVQS